MLRYPNEYSFIIGISNITGKESWLNMFLFYITSYWNLQSRGVHPSSKGYKEDTFNLYLISRQFPKFYEEVQYINLDTSGVDYDYVKRGLNESKWYAILFWMRDLSHYGIFNGIYNEIYSEIYKHPDIIIYNRGRYDNYRLINLPYVQICLVPI